MEKRSSLHDSNKLSLNITNISSPIAESTQINKSIRNKFPWGGKLSPTQQKYAAPNNLEKTTNKMSTSNHITAVKMSPINKNMIDSRVYTDIHSRGLASRVVKYHDNSMRLNRNLSAGNLYKKPGQFPIVHLNKNQIQYKANRNRPASVARIAPPDKAVFHANTRSSILRTSSIVPSVSLRKSSSDLSCENRPILHPVESDLVPTRSVLDALKEISRKRINNDDLDGNDIMKKHCKEAEDVLPRGINTGILSNSSTTVGNSFSIKRQRENQLSPNSKLNNPEQTIKKRMYTRNNDIISSLSSSLSMTNPKRKLSELQCGGINSGSLTSSSSENLISPKSKQPCNEFNNEQKQQIQQMKDKSKLNILQSSCMVINHITPLPPTPAIDERQNHPLKSYDIPMIRNVVAIENKAEETSNSTLKGNLTSQKLRLTLFNKNYDDEKFKKALNSRKNQREHNVENEIKFVKPRNSSLDQFEKNPIIEKMKQSRLELMLKGLRGELNDENDDNENDEDEIDISEQKSNKIRSEEVKTTNISASNAILTTSASMTFATNTTASTSTISSAVALKSNTTKQNDQKETNTSGSSSGFNFGIKSNNVNLTTSGLVSSSIVATTTASTANFSFALTPSTNANSKDVTTENTNLVTVIESSKATGFTLNISTTSDNSTSNSIANSILQFSQGGFENFKNQQQISTLSSVKSAFAPVSEISKFTENKVETLTTAATSSTALPTFSFGLKTPTSQQLPVENSSSGITGIPPPSTNSIFGNFTGNSPTTSSFKATESITATTTVSNLSNQPQKFVFNSTSNNTQENPTFGGFSTSSNVGFSGFSSIVSQPSTTASNSSTYTLGVPQKTTDLFGVQTTNSSNTSPFGVTEKSPFSTCATEAPKIISLFENKSSPGGFTFGTVKNSQETNTSKEKTSSSFTPFNSAHSSASGFSFKNPAITTTTAITSTATAQKSQFSFGNIRNQVGSSSFAPETSSSTNQILSTPTSGNFSFANSSKGTETAKFFSFNPSNQTQASFISSTSSAPAFSFGGNNSSSSTENKQTSFSFGGGNSANNSTVTTCAAPNFSFTSSTSQNTFGSFNANKSPTGAFSFSSPTNVTSTGFGTFNVPSTTGQTQQAGQSSNNKFSFSSLSNAKIENKPTESSSTMFSPTSGNLQNTQFGGQIKSFSFTGTPNITGSTQNLLSGSNTTSGGGSSIFDSGDATGLLKPPTSTSTFSFGSNSTNQQKTSNNSTPFTFGNSSVAGQQLNTSKPFTFGGSPNTSNNLFSSTNSNIDSSKVPAFNFSTQNNSTGTIHGITGSSMTRIQPSTNIFLGGPSNIDARPIKKATRRLNK